MGGLGSGRQESYSRQAVTEDYACLDVIGLQQRARQAGQDIEEALDELRRRH